MLSKQTSGLLLLQSLLFTASGVSAQFAGPIVSKGCYSSASGLNFAASFQYQSSGHCQQTCLASGQAVLGLTKGSDCWCGNNLPPTSDQVDSSHCSTTCFGYDEPCGGDSYWTVDLTGISNNVAAVSNSIGGGNGGDEGNDSDSDNSPSTTTDSQVVSTTLPPQRVTVGGGTQVVTIPGSTAVVPQTATPSSSPDSSGLSTGSKVGIAVGVVGGLAALGAGAGAAFLFLRARKEGISPTGRHRSNTSVTAFATGGSTSGMSTFGGNDADSRLDKSIMMERRESNGSVFADSEDYSRRILKVTNPNPDD